MKRQVKRNALNDLALKVWHCIAGCLLAPGIACASDADATILDLDPPAYASSQEFFSFEEENWEPNLSLDDTQPVIPPVAPNSMGGVPLIPWDPVITQSIIPIDQTSHSTAGKTHLQGIQAKIIPATDPELTALELPKLPSPTKGEKPDSKGVLPSEKAPPGTLPYGANTVVTPQSLIAQYNSQGNSQGNSQDNSQENLAGQLGNLTQNPQSILINFNNVGMIEFIRFVSRITNRNFIFNDQDLQFNVTIVSEEPTTIDNVMTVLLQELRIHSLFLIEQDNNFVIHTNPAVQGISTVIAEGLPVTENQRQAQIVTEVFRLNTLVPSRASNIIHPLLSDIALVESVDETSQLIVTDLAPNIVKVGELLKSLDSPLSGLVIGQYLVLNAFPDSLIPLAEKIMAPIAEGKPLVFVSHPPSNSIFIVSNPFLVERTIAVLSNLDINVGATRIFSPDALRFVSPNNPFSHEKPGQTTQYGLPPPPGQGVGAGGIQPGGIPGSPGYPGGAGAAGGPGGIPPYPGGPGGTGAIYGPNGEIILPGQPGYPGGAGQLGGAGAGGLPGYPQQGPGQIAPGGIGTPPNLPYHPGQPITPGQRAFLKELPPGHIARTQFAIYKLRYRKGNQIQTALNNIATSLASGGNTNQELIQSLTSIQYIETTNSMVFSGSVETIDKVLELIAQLDVPLRQVFIEILVLDTTLTDSLTYGVNWQARYSQPNASGAESFLTNQPLTAALDAAVPGFRPDASLLTTQNGFTLGLIGRTITHNGTEFATIAGFVEAIHMRTSANIIMNPKVIAEDNTTAEIFVGINTSFQTSSITNDRGNIITTNVDFRDVGTRLRVTPLLSNTDIITLDIEQTISSVTTAPTTSSTLTQTTPGPTTSQNNTKTRVHIPDGYFLVLSGMIQDEKDRVRQQVPCLGGIPIIGGLFSEKENTDTKRNVMVFLRPQIIDTEEQIEAITKQQQDVWRQKLRMREMYKYEVDEALDFFSIHPLDCCDHEQTHPNYFYSP